MKTIAISIDEPTLANLDALARRMAPRGKGRRGTGRRSDLVRQAVVEFLARIESTEREELERAILARHKKKLSSQTKAMLEEQAKP